MLYALIYSCGAPPSSYRRQFDEEANMHFSCFEDHPLFREIFAETYFDEN